MARIRTVKPEFWANEKMAKVSRNARLLALALLNIAEDHGVARANPAYVRGHAFPYDEDISAEDVRKLIVELEGIDYLRRFGYDGQAYLFIVGFQKHQRIDKPSKATLPQPPENILAEPSPSPREKITSPPGALQEPSPSPREFSSQEGKGREGKVEERKVEEAQAPNPPETISGPKFESGSNLFAWFQGQREEFGWVREQPPHFRALGGWFSEFMGEMNGDEERAEATIVAYAQDKYWIGRKALFSDFLRHWREFVPRKVA